MSWLGRGRPPWRPAPHYLPRTAPESGFDREEADPMSYRSGILTGVVATLLVVAAAGAGWWLYAHKPAEAAKPTPPPVPATVPKPFKEDSAAVTLTPEAE